MNFEKEETQLQFFGMSSSDFENDFPCLVELITSNLVKHALNVLKEELKTEIDIERTTKNIVERIVKDLNPFTTSVIKKFDETFDIPDSVPILGPTVVTRSDITQEKLDEMKGRFEELVKTYLRNKYLIGAVKIEVETYEKTKDVLVNEELIYKRMSSITNEGISVKDVTKIN